MRVLILRCGALGDLVYGTSVIEGLRAEHGSDVTIDVVCTPGAAGVFEFDARVSRVFTLRHRHVPLWLSAPKRAVVRASRMVPYDLLVNLESGAQFAPLARAIVARRKVGWFFTDPQPPAGAHVVEMCRAVARPALSEASLHAAVPAVFGAPIDAVRQRFTLPPRYLAISPGNSHTGTRGVNHRAWPVSRWVELLAALPPDLPVVVLGAAGDDPLQSMLPGVTRPLLNLAGRTSPAELIAIVAAADALVVTDTGPAHVASAVHTPLVCLVGPTNAGITGPYRTPHDRVATIALGLPCSPCHGTPAIRACPLNRCMHDITPALVLQALADLGVMAPGVSRP